MLFLKAPHFLEDPWWNMVKPPVAKVPLMPGTTALGFVKRGAGRAFTIPSRWQLGGPTRVPENLSGSFQGEESSIWMTKEQHLCPVSVFRYTKWSFPIHGGTPKWFIFYQSFHEINIDKPSIHWGTPMAMEPPWLWHSARNSKATALRDERSSVNRPHG